MKKTVTIAVCVLAALAVVCMQYVHRGYVGVTDARGAIRVMNHGLHLRAPWHPVTFYPVETRAVDVRSSLAGARGKTRFDLTLHMSVRRDSVPALHADYHGRYIEVLVVPLLTDFLESRAGGRSISFGPEASVLGKEIERLLDSPLGAHGIAIFGAELRSFEMTGGLR